MITSPAHLTGCISPVDYISTSKNDNISIYFLRQSSPMHQWSESFLKLRKGSVFLLTLGATYNDNISAKFWRYEHYYRCICPPVRGLAPHKYNGHVFGPTVFIQIDWFQNPWSRASTARVIAKHQFTILKMLIGKRPPQLALDASKLPQCRGPYSKARLLIMRGSPEKNMCPGS